jgi:hypothetical protein
VTGPNFLPGDAARYGVKPVRPPDPKPSPAPEPPATPSPTTDPVEPPTDTVDPGVDASSPLPDPDVATSNEYARTACTVVTPAEYQAVLGRRVRLVALTGTRGEPIRYHCDVLAGNTRLGVDPYLYANVPPGQYQRIIYRHWAAAGAHAVRPVRSLGPSAREVWFHGGDKGVYVLKGTWEIAMEARDSRVTMLQLVRLAQLASARIPGSPPPAWAMPVGG